LKFGKVAPPWNKRTEQEENIKKRKEPPMKLNTKKRKKATRVFGQFYGRQELLVFN